jgi:predicted nucleic acid-binding protein
VSGGAAQLWRGVTTDAERKTLRRYEALLPDYEISAEVWARAIGLAARGRASGVTVPLADLLIFACAKTHGIEIAQDDAHFDECVNNGVASMRGCRSFDPLRRGL